MGTVSPLRIAMVGSRGVPCSYGGIEKHVSEISSRLAKKGHEVTVYGRHPYCISRNFNGIRVKVLPAVHTKNLETASNTLAAAIASSMGRYDIVHFHGIGPSLFSWITSWRGKATVCTVHALDYRQSKWSAAARALLELGERSAMRYSDAVIAVSRLMASSLSNKYRRSIDYIPNGAEIIEPPEFSEAKRLGIEKGKYILAVGRFIVERGFHTLLEAWSMVETDYKLVIAGDARFEEDYAKKLVSMTDERVVMPGYVSGNLLDELYSHCAFFVLPSTVEGLSIALLEAMSFAKPVLVSDIEENLEVSRGIAETFSSKDAKDLAAAIERMLAMDDGELQRRGKLGLERVRAEYTWDRVADAIEDLYARIIGTRRKSI